MKIIKFGGSSVGSVSNLQLVLNILKSQEEHFVCVVSAFKGVTNQLQNLAEASLEGNHQPMIEEIKKFHKRMISKLLSNPSPKLQQCLADEWHALENISRGIYALQELTDKSTARIMAKGEILSSYIIAEFLEENGISIQRKDTRELISANQNYLNALVDFETTNQKCSVFFQSNENYIIPGFIAKNNADETTLLGRGGSDYTASIVGAALDATQIELWSDVSGMHNANPKLVQGTKPITEMSYEEAFEIAYFGAKVLYPPAIKPAMRSSIPVFLKNTLEPEHQGTKIHAIAEERSDKLLGVSTLSDISLVNITGVGLSRTKGSAKRVFEALEKANVNIILISQSCSEQSICFGLKSEDALLAKDALEQAFEKELKRGFLNSVEIKDNQIILALIGDQMRSQVGLSGKVFSALGENNVNVNAIAQGASERNISIVIDQKDEHKAVNVVHEKFFQSAVKKIHIFVLGVGNVGTQFLDIVEQQKEYCRKNFNVELRISLIANSKKYLFEKEGLDKFQIESFPQNGISYHSSRELSDYIIGKNLRNTIVIDNTASAEVSEMYSDFFGNSISLATCNKIASSSVFENFKYLQQLTKDHNCKFQYETAVGASLPVIKTIRDLRLSGDKIEKIQAVLSGSLNFIFNNYDATKPFVEIVQQAKDEGYTEPDPRIDLSGLDVRRKLLILARESGKEINLEDVKFDSFLPDAANKTNSVEEFMQILTENEAHFQDLYQDAQNNHAKLKVIAEMDGENYSVGLQQVSSDSPFYHLDGKDNIVALNTSLYQPEPLVVKGAGAGARITASGVFQDLMLIVNQS